MFFSKVLLPETEFGALSVDQLKEDVIQAQAKREQVLKKLYLFYLLV